MPASKNKNIEEGIVLKLAWDYFQQHANQRIRYFHFFVLFSSALTTGLIMTFQEDFRIPHIGIIIGLLLSVFSFVFWKIDERNKFLTKHGEDVIKIMEEKYSFGDPTYSDKLKLFKNEVFETEEWKRRNGKNIFIKQISHSKSFKIIFIIFGGIGILGALLPPLLFRDMLLENNMDSTTYVANRESQIMAFEYKLSELNEIIIQLNMQNYFVELNSIVNNIYMRIYDMLLLLEKGTTYYQNYFQNAIEYYNISD